MNRACGRRFEIASWVSGCDTHSVKWTRRLVAAGSALVCVTVALTGCQTQDSADTAPTASSSASSIAQPAGPPILLVTFSGESGAAIDQVYGVDTDGNPIPDLLNPGTLQLDELRGMAFDAVGNLYVANANKNVSQILKFSPSGNGYSNGVVFASPATTPGIDHPYGLAFGPGNDLLVSSQDSLVVTRLNPAGAVVPTAPFWTKQYPKANFYPGTWAPGAKGATSPNPPTPVKPSAGGLSDARGIAVVGNQLFVADDSSNKVLGYSLTDGSFTGVITSFTSGDPTGLVATPDGTGLYVGTQGTGSVHLINIANCTANCPHSSVISATSQVPLDAPSGLALRNENGQSVLYVGNRKGNAINRYQLSSPTQVQSASVFVSGLRDTPEQLLAIDGQNQNAPAV